MTQSSIQTEALPASKNSGLVFLCLCIALSFSAVTVAEENSEDSQQQISPPENWYQVEVILFTQQGDAGNEAPPADYQLAFPTSWQELIDPQLTEHGTTPPIAAGALLSLDRPHDVEVDPQPSLIPRAQVEDPAISKFQDQATEQQSTYLDIPADARALAAKRLAEAQALEQQLAQASAYQPRYEQTLLMLDSQFRDLNESALTLDRRGYNVVFHSAWRFASEGEASDPWLLIKAGQRLEDRHQIEGSLRFYKSRFLHFETDLWLAQFSNDSSQLVELPELPKPPKPKSAASHQSSDFYSHLVDLQPMNIETIQGLGMHSSAATKSIESLENLESLENMENLESLASPKLLDLTGQKPAKPKQYPVTELWTLKKSMRLDENQVYYIDHPRMGIMVSIKSYQPVLLNPPPIDSDNQTSDPVSE